MSLRCIHARKWGEASRGFIARKKRYFCGLRVEIMLAPGAESDIFAFRRLQFGIIVH
jgi:hypothetical protein